MRDLHKAHITCHYIFFYCRWPEGQALKLWINGPKFQNPDLSLFSITSPNRTSLTTQNTISGYMSWWPASIHSGLFVFICIYYCFFLPVLSLLGPIGANLSTQMLLQGQISSFIWQKSERFHEILICITKANKKKRLYHYHARTRRFQKA